MSDCLVAVSESERALFAELRFRPRGDVRVIPNGISVDAPPGPPVDVRQRLGIPTGAPIVGAVGRLVAQKDPLAFVAACEMAARQRPDVHFVLIGTGPLAERVDAAVTRWDIDRRFHHVDGVLDAHRWLGDMSVLVQASQYEGAPYVPLEAFRAGVPVVATDVVGNRDIIVTEHTGILVPPASPETLATAVIRVLDDQPLRERLVKSAGEALRVQFDVRKMGLAHQRLYEDLVRRQRSYGRGRR
jgi:glycosyltransferase involved in cell wall biosynthesis